MADPVSAGMVAKVVGKVLDELYDLGEQIFKSHLDKLKREAVRRKLIKRATACERVKTIWQLDKELRIPDFYYPSQINFGTGVTKVVSGLQHFPTKGNLLIEGTIGQGKSIFLRYLCAQELRGKGTNRIPVFVELRLIEVGGGLQSAILQALDEYGFDVTEELWHFYAASGKFVFLLDAFDELPDDAVAGVIRELDHLASKYPDLQVIVTTRPDSDIHQNRHFRRYRLAALTSKDHKPFLRKLLMNDANVNELLVAIETSPSHVASLMTTPLMLTLVAVVYRAERTIPPELPEFFELLFTTLFSRHDRMKGVVIRKRFSTLSEREMQVLFEAFCFMTRHHEMSTSLTDAMLLQALRGAMTYSGISCDPDSFYKDITRIACLLQREGAKTNFVHKSIQEFFAASFVRRANDAFAQRFYELQRNSRRTWTQEHIFLAQIDAYRFAKHYFMPEISALEDYCGIKFAQGVPTADGGLLKRLTSGSQLDVSVEDDSYLDSGVLLNVPEGIGPVLRRLMLLPTTVCYGAIDGAEGHDRAAILARLGCEDEDESEYSGDLFESMERLDLLGELSETLNAHLAVLKRRYDQLANVIRLEESKSNLFEGIEGPVLH
jgi:hypothetical protein